MIFINGLGAVSPQPNAGSGQFPFEFTKYDGNQLRCPDPGYKEFIPGDQIRRMGRVIKMGVTAAKLCLRDAAHVTGFTSGPECPEIIPEAIITGTGMGCMEDTEKFLATMIRNNEEFLTPTSFIQSTHNTVAGQIALLLKCHGYNFTYVHRGFSFENALLDAMVQLRSGSVSNVLAGGSDELTPAYFSITSRLGHWKRKPVGNDRLLEDHQRGSVAGEGATFFFLQKEGTHNSYARLRDVRTLLKPGSDEKTGRYLLQMLQENEIAPADIDLVVAGFNGDPGSDAIYRNVIAASLPGSAIALYKHLCGEYQTSTAFATWFSAMMIRHRTLPEFALLTPPPPNLRNILIYNHYLHVNHTFILLSAP
ncbi:MAG TPA: beta-ketoacyl synthase N-terminal-like domain-containing protein [Bacteroidales bacterium]|nr:beta-ketoacyl synthase N-terminal-like domain-containing protein [Bacteroidales bacterium]HPS50409.1 beta-ketoacyl synthase N-terminal-like domain-containing protein [Bacteroidales bacterium]